MFNKKKWELQTTFPDKAQETCGINYIKKEE